MHTLEIQTATSIATVPSEQEFQRWVDAALAGKQDSAEIVIRLVDEAESAQLNEQYRHKQGPTNILSFPVEIPEGIELNLLGDLVVCVPVIIAQANEQKKPVKNHWAHIIIHGVLHLLGFDHIKEDEAECMESEEIRILNTLQIDNPYTEVDD